ncbi:CTD kinase subunit gamma CTK3-domain-containing protein [Gongronella butleri]|nr:CTD kinase subunit gamma CTK3-domain-containing protein [Gongronella butleri]
MHGMSRNKVKRCRNKVKDAFLHNKKGPRSGFPFVGTFPIAPFVFSVFYFFVLTMGDPFECRLQFIALLKKLNASQTSIQKATRYALKYRQLSEDLYSCFLEELDTASINTRLNILYVLDSILSASRKAQYHEYVKLTQPDVSRIIRAVAPDTAKGIVNVASTRKLLQGWTEYFDHDTIAAAEQVLDARTHTSSGDTQQDDTPGFSRTDILHRMEQDRERHKLLREGRWQRPVDESNDDAFEHLWANTDALDKDADRPLMEQQNRLFLSDHAAMDCTE